MRAVGYQKARSLFALGAHGYPSILQLRGYSLTRQDLCKVSCLVDRKRLRKTLTICAALMH